MIANVFQKYPENVAFHLFIILQYLPVKFAIFVQSNLPYNSFYCFTCL